MSGIQQGASAAVCPARSRCVRSHDSRSLQPGNGTSDITDTYQEINGLLYADRTPKADLQQIAQATSSSGAQVLQAPEFNPRADQTWREDLMQHK